MLPIMKAWETLLSSITISGFHESNGAALLVGLPLDVINASRARLETQTSYTH